MYDSFGFCKIFLQLHIVREKKEKRKKLKYHISTIVSLKVFQVALYIHYHSENHCIFVSLSLLSIYSLLPQVTGCPVCYTILNGESLPISNQDCFHFSVVWFVVYCPAVSLMLIFYLFFTLFGTVAGQLVHLYLLKGVCQRNIYSFPYHKLMVLVFVDNLKLYLKKKHHIDML